MAQILYYSRKTGRRLPDVDNIADVALDRYPTSTGDEFAVARMDYDGRLRYSYDGGWHDQPPADVLERERREAEEERRAAEDAEIRSLPPVVITLVDETGVLVETPDGERAIGWDELVNAATQRDRVGRAMYGAVLAAANEAPRYSRTRIVVRA